MEITNIKKENNVELNSSGSDSTSIRTELSSSLNELDNYKILQNMIDKFSCKYSYLSEIYKDILSIVIRNTYNFEKIISLNTSIFLDYELKFCNCELGHGTCILPFLGKSNDKCYSCTEKDFINDESDNKAYILKKYLEIFNSGNSQTKIHLATVLGNLYFEKDEYESAIYFYKYIITFDNKKINISMANQINACYSKLHHIVDYLNQHIVFLFKHKNLENNHTLLNHSLNKLFNKHSTIIEDVRKILFDVIIENDIMLSIKISIYLETGIIPKRNIERYYTAYRIITNMRHTKLPKSIVNLIAGHLFI